MATIGFDDDGVKTMEFPIVRDGSWSACKTNRETAPLIGDKASKGCTSASSWRDYPFLRMPNVRLGRAARVAERGADDADTKTRPDRRRQLLDRPQATRPVRRQLLLEIKNGRDADGDRRHLQRDHHRFWRTWTLIGSQETWKMFGTGGDAKGQPTQTNSISHGIALATVSD